MQELMIKAVIFDWGGVLIDNPAPGLTKYCAQWLGVSPDDLAPMQERYMLGFQKSAVTEEEFWQLVCRSFGINVPAPGRIWGKAFSAVYKPKEEMFQLAAALRKNGYKTGFLSNTEIPAMKFFKQQGYTMFDVALFSCAEGTAKPEMTIYDRMVARLNVPSGSCVFIDDRLLFVQGAKIAGLEGILFQSVEQVKTDLKGLGIIF